jgi:hypothetical protein
MGFKDVRDCGALAGIPATVSPRPRTTLDQVRPLYLSLLHFGAVKLVEVGVGGASPGIPAHLLGGNTGRRRGKYLITGVKEDKNESTLPNC